MNTEPQEKTSPLDAPAGRKHPLTFRPPLAKPRAADFDDDRDFWKAYRQWQADQALRNL